LDASYGPGSEELLKAAAALKKVGDVTPVVRTARGFHALVLEAIVTDENAEALARAQVTHRLLVRERALAEARKFAESAIAAVRSGKSLDEALELELKARISRLARGSQDRAQKSDDRPKTDITAPFSIEQNPVPGFTGPELPGTLLFAMKEPGEITPNPLPLQDGFAVLQLKEKDLFTREKFEKERSSIVAELTRRKADQILEDHVEKLLEKSGPIRYNNAYAPTTREVASAPKTEAIKVN
jgi:hypothetical protein